VQVDHGDGRPQPLDLVDRGGTVRERSDHSDAARLEEAADGVKHRRVVVDEHTGEPVVMRESVGYIHHWIGSIFDRDRLPGDTGARVAGNLRVVPGRR